MAANKLAGEALESRRSARPVMALILRDSGLAALASGGADSATRETSDVAQAPGKTSKSPRGQRIQAASRLPSTASTPASENHRADGPAAASLIASAATNLLTSPDAIGDLRGIEASGNHDVTPCSAWSASEPCQSAMPDKSDTATLTFPCQWRRKR